MGNCQAAEAATVVIQHPAGNKVERIYFSVTARHVMNSNPGHFVALIVPPPADMKAEGVTVKHLKLLRPRDSLLLGQVYRLVRFEDVLKEFAAKKCVKLAKLLEGGGIVIDKNKLSRGSNKNQGSENHSSEDQQHSHCRGSSSSGRTMGKNPSSGGQWKPALQSISELGS